MIHPSYSELIEAINTNNEDDDESMVLNSRYSLILATSKRARQLILKKYKENPLVINAVEAHHGDTEPQTVEAGISPLGQRTHHKTVLDESALQYDEILLSGGKRGFSVGVNPNDLLKVLDAVAAPIGTW